MAAAIDYGLAAIARGEERAPPIPIALLMQAREAARRGVNLATVQRRYLAGNSILEDYLVRDAEREDLSGDEVLTRLRRTQSILFERLLTAISEEYEREDRKRIDTPEQRRIQRVQSLIDGEPIDTKSLPYDFGMSHLGIVAIGPRSTDAIRELVLGLDRRILLVPRSEHTTWAWIGGNSKTNPSDIARRASRVDQLGEVSIAIGEPANQLSGWRLTHKQAVAALYLAQRTPTSIACYVDDPLLASCVRDDLLMTSLREIYLSPLTQDARRGEERLRTLRAYFLAKQSVSGAGALLKMSPPAVRKRLSAIEAILESPIDSILPELEIAIRLHDLGPPEANLML